MTKYSESELKYARPIAQAILDRAGFREWILMSTPYETLAPSLAPIASDIQRRLRSRNLKNPYWFNYWCGKDARCRCRIGAGIETDVLIVLETPDSRRIAVHIEIKRPHDDLGSGQAESYPRRAACWADETTRPRTVPPHDRFLTMLVCGRNLEADERTKYFDRVLFHDEIENQLAVYPED